MLEEEVACKQGYSYELPIKVGELVVHFGKTPMHCLTVVWRRMGLCQNMLTFGFMCIMHHPYLVCIRFWHAIPTSSIIL